MYAPVIIPTLNRYEHLRRCIDSLRCNSLAEETEVYISLDYPPSEKYEEGYKRVKEYLATQIDHGFKAVYIFYQDKNLGPSENAYFLRREVYKKYDKYIFTEDDNEFAPNFLQYLNEGLEIFKDDTEVLAICGYRNEKAWECRDANVMKVCVFHAWGYATWKHKIEKCHNWICRKNFVELLRDRKFCNYLYSVKYKSYYTFIQALLANPDDESNVYINDKGDIEEIDYTVGIYMIAFNMCCILPEETKVRNWGYDGSGVNCGRIDSINPQNIVIDSNTDFHFIFPSSFEQNENNKLINKEYDYYEMANKARFFRMIMCVFGVPFARKINNLLYKITIRKSSR